MLLIPLCYSYFYANIYIAVLFSLEQIGRAHV